MARGLGDPGPGEAPGRVPVLTDVHGEAEIADVAAVVDVLQTPAFLCRQTDFIRAVAQSGKPVNIKKGQFLAPHDMKNVIDKGAPQPARRPARRRLHGLRARRELRLQQPRLGHALARDPARDRRAGGLRRDALRCSCPAARARRAAASASSCRCSHARRGRGRRAGLFMETHPDPANALSDGPTRCR